MARTALRRGGIAFQLLLPVNAARVILPYVGVTGSANGFGNARRMGILFMLLVTGRARQAAMYRFLDFLSLVVTSTATLFSSLLRICCTCHHQPEQQNPTVRQTAWSARSEEHTS